MGELAGINSIIEAWRVRLNDETTPFVVTSDDKDFVKQIFPNRKFISGCKDCYKDVIIELVTQGLPAEPVVYEVTEDANFVLCEKTFKNGFAVFVGKDKKRFFRVMLLSAHTNQSTQDLFFQSFHQNT
jgi:hypothetical protein